MKTLQGTVKSTKMPKSAVVEVASFKEHPLYRKRFKITKRYLAHNELKAAEGDKVILTEGRPLSAKKRFSITKIIK